MWWIDETHTRPSAKNGTIVMRRTFGQWNISVNGTGQTSPYTHSMWIEGYKRITKLFDKTTVKKVLMLGLGAGGEIKLLYKTFPNCTLTVIEFDEEMVKLTHEFGFYKPYPAPTVLVGDAAEVVPKLTDMYDFIIVDLFSGPDPSPLSTNAEFLRALGAHLAPDGHLIANVYGRPEYLDHIGNFFEKIDQWKFALNSLGLFTQPKT